MGSKCLGLRSPDFLRIVTATDKPFSLSWSSRLVHRTWWHVSEPEILYYTEDHWTSSYEGQKKKYQSISREERQANSQDTDRWVSPWKLVTGEVLGKWLNAWDKWQPCLLRTSASQPHHTPARKEDCGSPFVLWSVCHQATRTKGAEAASRTWSAVSATEITFWE